MFDLTSCVARGRSATPSLASALATALLVGCGAAAISPTALRTTAESTEYLQTGHYDEAVTLCHAFPRAFPGKARCEELGRTAQGRPILSMIVSGDGVLSPSEAKRARRPVLLVQAGIHAGEIEGKDAGFAFLRDLLEGKLAPGGATAVTVVFIPVLNPDGHERRAANNRPNQRGPAEMGFRTNSQNQNLNRDFLKADSAEIRAVLGALTRWDPVIFLDLHTTDGAQFEHDVAVMVSPQVPRPDALDEAAAALSNTLQARLTALGHLPLPFYPSFVENDEPLSGFARGDAPPRFSTPYAADRGRLGILVETHSWRTYKERAQSMYHTLQVLLELSVTEAASWRAAADRADAELAQLAGAEVPLLWGPTGKAEPLAFRGYQYETFTSEISGAPWIRYDETQPQIWNVPLYAELAPTLTVKAPMRGYVVDGGFAPIARERLDAHGIRYHVIAGTPRAAVQVFRASDAAFDPPFEGRTRARLTGAWTDETRALETGAIFIPIAQPRARLVLNLFEPSAPDSLAAWGFFNAVFEQKEYMEAYVAEQVAREMLRDPHVAAAYQQALADDPEMSPRERLQFFYRRHPSWDERMNLLPVFRVETASPELEGSAP
ncbi:MAG: M14 family zinc carboxypeptidase [Kofleriaceae bacterium]